VFKLTCGRAVATALVVVGFGLVPAACGGGSSSVNLQEIARAERHARQEKAEKEKERRLERKLAKLEQENRLAKKHRQEKERLEKKEQEAAHITVVPTETPAPSTPSGTDCGDGVIAGPETSCGFALNTRAEYEAEIGEGSGSIEAFSEANEKWYPMFCTGAPHECSGAISATVYFP
jgi:ATPase subunit of ABC transporter with duplicated ATPase domains